MAVPVCRISPGSHRWYAPSGAGGVQTPQASTALGTDEGAATNKQLPSRGHMLRGGCARSKKLRNGSNGALWLLWRRRWVAPQTWAQASCQQPAMLAQNIQTRPTRTHSRAFEAPEGAPRLAKPLVPKPSAEAPRVLQACLKLQSGWPLKDLSAQPMAYEAAPPALSAGPRGGI